MQRRSFIKKVGGIGAATAAGGAGLAAMTGGAAASSFSFEATDVKETFHDGDVENIFVDIDGDLSWSNFDEDVTHMDITIESRIKTNDNQDVVDGWIVQRDGDARDPVELPDDVAGHTGSYSGQIGSPKLSLYSSHETSPFDVGADGDSDSLIIELRLTIDLLNSDHERADPQDKARVQETTTFRVTIGNAEATTSGNATAKADAE